MKITVYHGSNGIVETPGLEGKDRPTEFGIGFYVSKEEEKAKAWALDKANREGKTAMVSKYDLKVSGLTVKKFPTPNQEWFTFVMRNIEQGGNIFYGHEVDYIEGPAAGNYVRSMIRDYKEGKYTIEQALEVLDSLHLKTQICLCSKKAIRHLKYLEFKVV